MDVMKLKEKIKEKGKTQEGVADAMGINRTTLHRKVKSGGTGFTVGDIQKMMLCIPLTRKEAMDIFFDGWPGKG